MAVHNVPAGGGGGGITAEEATTIAEGVAKRPGITGTEQLAAGAVTEPKLAAGVSVLLLGAGRVTTSDLSLEVQNRLLIAGPISAVTEIPFETLKELSSEHPVQVYLLLVLEKVTAGLVEIPVVIGANTYMLKALTGGGGEQTVVYDFILPAGVSFEVKKATKLAKVLMATQSLTA